MRIQGKDPGKQEGLAEEWLGPGSSLESEPQHSECGESLEGLRPSQPWQQCPGKRLAEGDQLHEPLEA